MTHTEAAAGRGARGAARRDSSSTSFRGRACGGRAAAAAGGQQARGPPANPRGFAAGSGRAPRRLAHRSRRCLPPLPTSESKTRTWPSEVRLVSEDVLGMGPAPARTNSDAAISGPEPRHGRPIEPGRQKAPFRSQTGQRSSAVRSGRAAASERKRDGWRDDAVGFGAAGKTRLLRAARGGAQAYRQQPDAADAASVAASPGVRQAGRRCSGSGPS